MEVAKEGICIRFAKIEEFHRLSELIGRLQRHQNMSRVYRIPISEELKLELNSFYKQEDGEKILPNFGTYTVVAIDERKLDKSPDDYVVGYLIYCNSYSIISGRRIFITSFFIEEDYRRLGIGKMFMEFLQNHSKKIGLSRIDVPFMKNNKVGIGFYKKLGATLADNEYQIYKYFFN